MKVEVIKCLSHSIELILGETSVCITPNEAENLIAQLRAVVPAPSDVEEAAEKWAATTHFEWPNQVPAGKKGFIAGMLAERERMASCPTIKGWIARDEDGALSFFGSKPYRNFGNWVAEVCIKLNRKLFPRLKMKNGPMKVKLIILK